MIPTKVFVGSLPVGTKPEELRRIFEQFGIVTECDIMNRCGFVHMQTEDAANDAIKNLNNSVFNGANIVVERGRMKERKPGMGGMKGPGGPRQGGLRQVGGSRGGFRGGFGGPRNNMGGNNNNNNSMGSGNQGLGNRGNNRFQPYNNNKNNNNSNGGGGRDFQRRGNQNGGNRYDNSMGGGMDNNRQVKSYKYRMELLDEFSKLNARKNSIGRNWKSTRNSQFTTDMEVAYNKINNEDKQLRNKYELPSLSSYEGAEKFWKDIDLGNMGGNMNNRDMSGGMGNSGNYNNNGFGNEDRRGFALPSFDMQNNNGNRMNDGMNNRRNGGGFQGPQFGGNMGSGRPQLPQRSMGGPKNQGNMNMNSGGNDMMFSRRNNNSGGPMGGNRQGNYGNNNDNNYGQNFPPLNSGGGGGMNRNQGPPRRDMNMMQNNRRF